MSSKRINNKVEKRGITKHELMHRIAVLLKPEMDKWMTVGARLRSFDKNWPFDNEKDAKCTSIAVSVFHNISV